MNSAEVQAAKMICKSIDDLAKEVRWFRLLIEEAAKQDAAERELQELDEG